MQGDGKSTHAGKRTSLFSSASSSASPLLTRASVCNVCHQSLQFLPSTAETVRHRLEFLVPLSFLFPEKEKQNEGRGNETRKESEGRSDPEKSRTHGNRLASEDLQWCVRELLQGVDLLWDELSKQESLRDTTLHHIASFIADGGGDHRSEAERQPDQDDSFRKNEKRLDETYSEERTHTKPELPGLGGKQINGERQVEESGEQVTVRKLIVKRFLGFPFQDFDLTNEWLWKKVTSQFNYGEHWDLYTPVVS